MLERFDNGDFVPNEPPTDCGEQVPAP